MRVFGQVESMVAALQAILRQMLSDGNLNFIECSSVSRYSRVPGLITASKISFSHKEKTRNKK